MKVIEQQTVQQQEQRPSAAPPQVGVSGGGEALLEFCPACGRSFRHREFLDHLFQNRDCMRAYWEEEERTHAYRVRHRSLNRKKERMALEEQQKKLQQQQGTSYGSVFA